MFFKKKKKEKNISNNFRNVSEENILQIKTEFGKEIYKNPIEQYNCGGFALGKTIWFDLFNWENSLLLLDELEFFNKESYEKALKEKIEKIAKNV